MILRRVLFYTAIIYCVGLYVGSLFFKNVLPVLFILVLIVILSIYLYLRGRKIDCLIYLCVFLLGVYSTGNYIYRYKRQADQFKGRNITISGQISSDVLKEAGTVKYTVYADSIEVEGKYYNVNCKFNVIDFKNRTSYVIPYNLITLHGSIDENSGFHNTRMQPYEDYLMIKGIYGTISADYSPSIKSVTTDKRKVEHSIFNLKSKILNMLYMYLDKDNSSLMKGILLGDTSGIDGDEYSSFKKAGIIHIFAVSGYNIWLFYMLLNYALFFLTSRPKLKGFSIIIILGIYAVISGWTPSVVRAYIMTAVHITGKMISKETDQLTSLAVSALIILAVNPLCIFDAGFILSFTSVLSIILLFPRLKSIRLPGPGWLTNNLQLSAAVQLGIFPITSYYYNSVQVLSIVTNLIIVPLVSVYTICGIILCIFAVLLPSAASVFGSASNILGHIIWSLTAYFSSLSFASINIISPAIIEIACYYIVIAVMSGIIIINIKYKQAIMFTVLVFIIAKGLASMLPGKLSISFVDVGQGDCIFIITPDKKTVLIDGGGNARTAYSDFDVGERIVKPYLLKHGIKKIDLIISTHSHDDHLLGLIPVMQCFNVSKFVKQQQKDASYISVFQNISPPKPEILDVSFGDTINVGKRIKLYVLNPEGYVKDENDSSIVVKLEYNKFSALFTGDISENVEDDLINYPVEADVLKIPHHGSSSSLKQEFLDAVNPEAAVICVGRNSFGHPSNSVLDILKENNIKTFRTDVNGEVTVTTDGLKYSINTAFKN